jgi:hypothetical protein
MVSNNSSYVGKALIIRFYDTDNIVESGKEYFSVLSSAPKITKTQKETESNEEEKDRLSYNIFVFKHSFPLVSQC